LIAFAYTLSTADAKLNLYVGLKYNILILFILIICVDIVCDNYKEEYYQLLYGKIILLMPNNAKN